MSKDIRWKQRFANYLKALELLKFCAIQEGEHWTQKDTLALIQAFEMTEELSCKLIKDYLKAEGIVKLDGHITIIREAFNQNIISDAQTLIDAIDARNLTSHIYNEVIAKQLVEDILNKFLPAFEVLAKKFTQYQAAD